MLARRFRNWGKRLWSWVSDGDTIISILQAIGVWKIVISLSGAALGMLSFVFSGFRDINAWYLSMAGLIGLAFGAFLANEILSTSRIYRRLTAIRAEQGTSETSRITNLEALVARLVEQPGNVGPAGPPGPVGPTGLSGLLISRAHITANGTFGAQAENISSIGDDGTGLRTIVWAEDYANPDYYLGITPTRGRFEIEYKSVGSVSIRTFGDNGLSQDVPIDIFAIGES